MKVSTKSTLSKYWVHVRRHPILAAMLVLVVTSASTTSAIIPLYFKQFFDVFGRVAAPNELTSALIRILVIIAVLEFIRWSFWRISGFLNNIFQPRIMTDLANQCFQYLHKHSFSFFNSNFVGSLVKRVNYFTRAFESTADRITWNVLPLAVELAVIMVVLFSTHPILGAVAMGWVIIFCVANLLFANFQVTYDLRRSEAETKATGFLADTITNHSNVKLFSGYQREVTGFARALETVRRLRMFTWNLGNLFDGLQGLLAMVLEIGAFYIAIRLWSQGLLTIGDFVLLQTYIIIIFEKVWDFGKLLRHMYTDLADAEEMTKILDTPHEVQDITRAPALQVKSGAISFDKVDFYYHETRPIFTNFNLIVAPREKVALVGPSGAGKSTVVKLLLRLHDVTSGRIDIDEQSVARVSQESLWQQVSLVPQEPMLFHRTLLENIRYGNPAATDAEVYAAAERAHCAEFIKEFPDQYATFVGERGVKLSGGERQRVAIARAILRNAPILVLDEATSSLDSESEALIQDALSILMQNKTVIVIAHRLSTIMKMDRIVVIDHGAVVESGTHEQLLLKTGGLYRELWRLQAGGFIADIPPKDTAETLERLELRREERDI